MKDCAIESRSGVLPSFVFSFTVVVLSMLFAAWPASATSISGSWKGGGIATDSEGKKHRIRCRVTIRIVGSRAYDLSGKCNSSDGIGVVSGKLKKVSSASYTGTINREGMSETGNIVVTAKDKKLHTTVTRGKASLSMVFTRN